MKDDSETEGYRDQASGKGTYGLSDGFYERANIRSSHPERVVVTYRIQIPEDVDHWREENKKDDYGLRHEKQYAERLAKRKFKDEFGFGLSHGAEINIQDYRETGVRPSDGFRSAFIVRIDSHPGYEHEPDEPDEESDIFLTDDE